MTLAVTSTAFATNGRIPMQFTGDGQNDSPPLAWAGVPDGAKELALICDDPDAPTPQPWVHWLIYRIRAGAGGLPKAVAAKQPLDEPAGTLQGMNSWDQIGYGGPAPPRGHGMHRYRFQLFALDSELDVESGLDKAALLAAMSGHVLAEGELVGTYQR